MRCVPKKRGVKWSERTGCGTASHRFGVFSSHLLLAFATIFLLHFHLFTSELLVTLVNFAHPQGKKIDEADYEISLPDGPFPPPRLIKGKPVRVSPYESEGSSLFPKEHSVFDAIVLQVTDFQSNFNKYYGWDFRSFGKGKKLESRVLTLFISSRLELHYAKAKGKEFYRTFSHYGRTDDLESNPQSGKKVRIFIPPYSLKLLFPTLLFFDSSHFFTRKECRYFSNEEEALIGFRTVFNEKTSEKKGYKILNLVQSNIGSEMRKAKAKVRLFCVSFFFLLQDFSQFLNIQGIIFIFT